MKLHHIRRAYVNPDYLPEQERGADGFNLNAESFYLAEFSLAEFVRGKHPAEYRDALIYSVRRLTPREQYAAAIERGEIPNPYAGPEVFAVISYCGRKVFAPFFGTARDALRFVTQKQLEPGGVEAPILDVLEQ